MIAPKPKDCIYLEIESASFEHDKKGGFLLLLLLILGALGALGGGAAGILKAVNDAKTNKPQLEEQKRHNAAIETSLKRKGLIKKASDDKGIFLNYPFRKNSQ